MRILHVVEVLDSLCGDSINLLASVCWVSLFEDSEGSDHGRRAFRILELRHDIT